MSNEPPFNLVTGTSWDVPADDTAVDDLSAGLDDAFGTVIASDDPPVGEQKQKNPVMFKEPSPTLFQQAVENEKALGAIKMPRIKGLTFDYWKALVNAAAMLGRLGERITPDNLKEYCPHIPIDTISATAAHTRFAEILEYRGIIDDTSPVGLTERQIMTLNMVTNFTDTRQLGNKLKSIGVSSSEFQQWLSTNRRFKTVYRKLSEQLFDEAQAAVNTALTTGAVQGDIRFIKLFNEMSSRWDPARQNVQDVRQVLTAVVEVINSTVKDPDLLREIAGKLSNVMIAAGSHSNSNSSSYRRELN